MRELLAPRSARVGTLLFASGWTWAMTVLAVAALLMSDRAMPGGIRLSASRALFHAASAGSLTGFSATPGLADLQPYGQGLVLGLAVFSSVLMLVVGGLMVRGIAGSAVGGMMVVAVAVAMPIVGVLLGMTAWTGSGSAGAVLGLAAVTHSGLTLAVPGAGHPGVAGVLLPLAAAGGVGAFVVADGLTWLTRRGHRVSWVTRWTLAGACAVWLGLVGMFWWTDGTVGGLGGGLVRAGVVAGSAMGWGLPVEYAGAWPRPVQAVVMMVCLMGVGMGSTAGGMGVVVVMVLLRQAWGAVRPRPAAEGTTAGVDGGVRLADWAAPATLIAATYGLLVVGVGLALLHTEPQLQFDRVLMLAVGSVSNAALSPDAVSVVGPGLVVMSAGMMLGRAAGLAGLYVLWRRALGR